MEKGEHLKRQNRPTMLQLQYLQRLSRVEKKRGAQGSIAESYGVNRSTVNRYFKNCIERGILTESLEFTAAGEEWLERYTKLYENLEKYRLNHKFCGISDSSRSSVGSYRIASERNIRHQDIRIPVCEES